MLCRDTKTTGTLIEKTFNEVAHLQVQRFSPSSSCWEAWWFIGRCDAGAESAISCRQQEIDCHTE